jgi:hypothetical protein
VRTKLEIRDEVEDVVGYIDIGEDEDFPFTLTKSLASLKNISKRGGAYSKTFKVPSTKQNNKLLHYLYSSNQKTVKGFRSRKPANVFVDNVIIERGYVKITDIEIKNGTEYYVMTFFGDNVKWMTDLAETHLNDLTYSNNTQTYDEAHIRASWDKTYGDGYDHVFPWICYGAHTNGLGLQVEDFYPALRYRAIIEKSLNEVGYTLSSTFMDTANFKQLIFPYVGGAGFKLSQAYVDTRLFRAGKLLNAAPDGNQKFYKISGNPPQDVVFVNTSPSPLFDTGGNYSTSTSRFTAPTSGKYKFNVFIIFGGGAPPSSYSDTLVDLMRGDDTVATNFFHDPAYHLWDLTLQNINGGLSKTSGWVTMSAGETVRVTLRYPDLWGYAQIMNGSYFRLLEQSKDITENDDFDLSDVMPNIKVLDLFADITKLFNLYWLTDSKTKTVYVETRDDFFQGITSAVDWTEKIAIDKDYTIKFLTDYKRELLFKYAEDSKDGYLKKRNEAFEYANNLYCSYKHTFSDRFPKGEDSLKCGIIAPTYIIEDNDVVTSNAYQPYGITSRMWKDASVGHSVKSLDFAPRILNYQYDTQTKGGNNCYITVEGVNQTTIPSALAIEVYGNTVPYSLSFAQADGLFANYYKNTMAVIQDGIQLVAYFKLTATEYKSLDFREPIYLKNPEEVQGYWIIDTISDFSPLKPLTKMTLLKYHNQDYLGMIGDITEIDYGWSPPPFPDDEAENYTDGDGELDIEDNFPEEVITTGSLDLPDGVVSSWGGGNPPTPGVQMSNGTGNLCAVGSGSLAIGQGCEARYPGQTMMGSYPEITDDIVAIGVGSETERVTGLRMTSDGDVTIYGGEIYILDGSGEKIPVTIEPNGKIKKIYLK